MSKFIVDSRLSVYIEKDFYNLLTKFDKSSLTIKDLIKMYAFSIYKNLYYFDYNKLSKNSACLNYSFQMIRFLKEDKTKEIYDKLLEKEELLRNRSETQFLTRDLFKIFLKGIFWEKGHNYGGSTINIDATQCIKIEFGKSYNIHFTVNGYSQNKFLDYNEIENYCYAAFHNSFNDCISSLELSNEDSLNNLRLEVNKLRSKKNKIMNMSIQQFMEENNCNELNNEFLKICLTRGYIEADFYRYYDTQKKSYFLENDSAFVRYNVDNEDNTTIQNNYSYPLNEVSKVVQNIPAFRFKYSRILNFHLVNYIFDNNKNIKEITDLFNTEDNKVIQFFEEYLKTQDIDRCNYLSKNFAVSCNFIPAFANVIGILDTEKQNSILNILINKSDLSTLTIDNIQKILNIINSYTNWQGININDGTIQNICSLGEIKLNFVKTLDSLSLKKIEENNAFAYNYSNLVEISNRIYDEKDELYCLNSFISKGNESIKSSIIENLCELLSIFKEQKFETDNIDVIMQSQISIENKKTFIEKARFSYVIKEITDKTILESIVENAKIEMDIKNIFNISEILKEENFSEYFFKNTFNNIKFYSLNEIVDDQKFKEFEKRIIHPKLLSNENNVDIARKFNISDFQISKLADSNLDNNIQRLIENGIVLFSAENLNNLQHCYNSYLSLIKFSPEDYFSLLKENKLKFTNDLISYLICNLDDLNDNLINYFINNYGDQINFWFKDSSGKLYSGDLLNKIKNTKIDNVNILKKMLELKLENDNLKLTIINIVKDNHKLFVNTELSNLLYLFDEEFNKCKTQNLDIPKNSKAYLLSGFELLKEIGYIKIHKGPKNWKISKIS